MRGGRFLSCRYGAMGVVHLVVVHGPGHGVDFSGIVCSNVCGKVSKKGKKKFQRFFFIILGEKKKSARQPGVRFFLEKIGKSVQSSDLIKNIHLVFFFYQQHTNPYDAPK